MVTRHRPGRSRAAAPHSGRRRGRGGEQCRKQQHDQRMRALLKPLEAGSMLHCNPDCQHAEAEKGGGPCEPPPLPLFKSAGLPQAAGAISASPSSVRGRRVRRRGAFGSAVAFDDGDGRRDGRRQHVERDPLAFGLRRRAVDLAARALAILARPPLLAILAVALGAEVAARTLGAVASCVAIAVVAVAVGAVPERRGRGAPRAPPSARARRLRRPAALPASS